MALIWPIRVTENHRGTGGHRPRAAEVGEDLVRLGYNPAHDLGRGKDLVDQTG